MADSSIVTSNVGLVLAGHGSEFGSYKETVEQLAAMVRKRSHFLTVQVGFMELSNPSIHDALTRAVEAGAEKVIVVPVLLAESGHTTEDIPRLLGMVKGQNRGTFTFDRGDVQIVYCKPVGADTRLAEIIIDRATEAFKDLTSNVGLVLIGHGCNFGPYMEMVEELGAIIRKRSIFMTVKVGFMELASPTIHDALSSAVEAGAKKLIAVPVLLAEARHTTEDIPRLLGLEKGQKRGTFSSQSRGDVEVTYCKPIGPDRRLAEMILDRATEALKDSGPGITAELTSKAGGTESSIGEELASEARE